MEQITAPEKLSYLNTKEVIQSEKHEAVEWFQFAIDEVVKTVKLRQPENLWSYIDQAATELKTKIRHRVDMRRDGYGYRTDRPVWMHVFVLPFGRGFRKWGETSRTIRKNHTVKIDDVAEWIIHEAFRLFGSEKKASVLEKNEAIWTEHFPDQTIGAALDHYGLSHLALSDNRIGSVNVRGRDHRFGFEFRRMIKIADFREFMEFIGRTADEMEKFK